LVTNEYGNSQISFINESNMETTMDILLLDKEILLVAQINERKYINIRIFLKAGVDHHKYFTQQDEYFIIPYIKQYFKK